MPSWTSLILSGVALALAIAAWHQGGPEAALQGLKTAAWELLKVTPLLLAAFLVAGLTQALISPQVVEHWLGSKSGWRGILLAGLAGALIPGGPYVYYPIAGALLQSGAGLGVLMAFISAKNFWSLSRLAFEFALLGPHLTVIRYLLTLVIPIAAGFLAEALFGRTIHRIREAVR